MMIRLWDDPPNDVRKWINSDSVVSLEAFDQGTSWTVQGRYWTGAEVLTFVVGAGAGFTEADAMSVVDELVSALGVIDARKAD